MQLILALSLLAIISIVLANYRKKHRHLPAFVEIFLHGDSLFLATGFILGPYLLNILNKQAIVSLTPLIEMGLGGIGFIYGTHLEWKRVKRFPNDNFKFAFFESIGTLVFVALGIWALSLLPWITIGDWKGDRISIYLIVGALACGTTPSALFLLSHKKVIKSKFFRAIQFASTLDDLPAIIMIGIIYAIEKSTSNALPLLADTGLHLKILLWIFMSIGLGLIVGYLFHFLVEGLHKESVVILFLLGTILLCAGLATYLNLSPLFVSVIAGVTFANISAKKEYIFGVLSHREHSIYLLFLILAGASLRFNLSALLPLVVCLVVLRIISKVSLGGIGLAMGKTKFDKIGRMQAYKSSLALLPQGGMTMALAFNIYLDFNFAVANQLLTATVISVFIFEIFTAVYLNRIKIYE
jgi:Kef-type K+ transport system membrane component KefB